MTKYSISNPIITKIMDISTIHIHKKDSDLLNDLGIIKQPVAAYRYEFGHFICINEFLNREELLKAGYSKEFCDIIDLALEKGCDFIKLDGDGIIYKDLKQIEW